MFQKHTSKMPIFAYSSLWHIFTMVFIGYMYSSMCRHIVRCSHGSHGAVVRITRYSSLILRHYQGIVTRSKIVPSDPDPEAELSSSFPSSFLFIISIVNLLHRISSLRRMFCLQQRKKIIVKYLMSVYHKLLFLLYTIQLYCSISEYCNIIGLYYPSATICCMCHKLMLYVSTTFYTVMIDPLCLLR